MLTSIMRSHSSTFSAAKGESGTYQPATGDVTLEGNVVLTRGQNVIRGARLLSLFRLEMKYLPSVEKIIAAVKRTLAAG